MRFIFSLLIVFLLVLGLSYGKAYIDKNLNDKMDLLFGVLGDSDSSVDSEESDDSSSDTDKGSSSDTDNDSSSVETATFIFNGQNVTYEVGMTWEDYINSVYNIVGLRIKDGDVYDDTQGRYLRDYNQTNVSASNLIMSNKYYSSEVETVTFIFNGQYVTYEAGMTWDEFIESKYNTIGLVRYNYVAAFSHTKYLVKTGTTDLLVLGDPIEQANYTVYEDNSGSTLI